MDIDEFLDRELGDLGLAEKNERDLPPLPKAGSAPSIVDSVNVDLNKKGLDQAEQSYIKLWSLLAQQKLEWNKDLYEQLYSLSKQLSSALGEAYEEIKKKSNHIYSLVSYARIALKEGKKDVLIKLYAEMQEINNSIPAVFFEEKKAIQEQITLFYRELVNTTDSELSRRVANIVNQVMRLLESIDNSLMSGNTEDALVNYIKCINLFGQIPEGFLKTRNSMGMRLLDIYRTLSIHAEISKLQKQLGLNIKADLPRTQPSNYAGAYQKPEPMVPAPPRPLMNSSYQPKKSETFTISSSESLLNKKREHAKKNIKKGFYNEAWKDVEEALLINPEDIESKTLKAKIKTLQ